MRGEKTGDGHERYSSLPAVLSVYYSAWCLLVSNLPPFTHGSPLQLISSCLTAITCVPRTLVKRLVLDWQGLESNMGIRVLRAKMVEGSLMGCMILGSAKVVGGGSLLPVGLGFR